jgi:hypothetical protein
VFSSGYRTFGNQCEQLGAELGVRRGDGTPVVIDDGSRFFEHAWLLQFVAPT